MVAAMRLPFMVAQLVFSSRCRIRLFPNRGVPHAKRLERMPPLYRYDLSTSWRIAPLTAITAKMFGFCSAAIMLQILEPILISDSVRIFKYWVTNSAVCGVSIGQKYKGAEPITWAAPRRGPRSHGTSVSPQFTPLCFPEMGVSPNKQGTSGVTHATFERVGIRIGRPLVKLHSPRFWCSTCARQLLLEEETRASLGMWRPGSHMPGLYDRAEFGTEMARRTEILTKVQGSRRRANPFGIHGAESQSLADSSADSTSESATSPFIYKIRGITQIEEDGVASTQTSANSAVKVKKPPRKVALR